MMKHSNSSMMRQDSLSRKRVFELCSALSSPEATLACRNYTTAKTTILGSKAVGCPYHFERNVFDDLGLNHRKAIDIGKCRQKHPVHHQKEKRNVSFDLAANIIYAIEVNDDVNVEVKAMKWYSARDYAQFAKRASNEKSFQKDGSFQSLPSSAENSVLPSQIVTCPIQHTTLGNTSSAVSLSSSSSNSMHSFLSNRKKRNKNVISAVLAQQKFQRRTGIHNEWALYVASSVTSRWARATALATGALNAETASEILREVDDGQNTISANPRTANINLNSTETTLFSLEQDDSNEILDSEVTTYTPDTAVVHEEGSVVKVNTNDVERERIRLRKSIEQQQL